MSTPTPEYYRKRIPVSREDIERGYVEVDPYRIARLWELNDPALFQAFKKVLCGGQRGGKDKQQDAVEARDALNRWLELEGVENGFGKLKCYLHAESRNMVVREDVDGTFDTWKLSPYSHWENEAGEFPPSIQKEYHPISAAEARALVEKAGGVW